MVFKSVNLQNNILFHVRNFFLYLLKLLTGRCKAQTLICIEGRENCMPRLEATALLRCQ
jgi:hypothetical protein